MSKTSKNQIENLNKFEKTRLLSARALELSNGAEPKIKVDKEILLTRDFVKVAEQELEEGKLELEILK